MDLVELDRNSLLNTQSGGTDRGFLMVLNLVPRNVF